MKRQKLSVYRLKDRSQGFAFRTYRDLIKEDQGVTEYRLTKRFPFTGRLFLGQPVVTLPSWLDFLRPGFGELLDIPESTAISAVLFIQQSRDEGIYYALTFGFGRHLVKPEVILKKFGLRLVLNLMYSDPNEEGSDNGRVREVAAKTISDNTVHTIKQASRGTEFEAFGIDVYAEILRSITGRPVDMVGFGKIVSGGDAAGINPTTEFGELGNLCARLELEYQSNSYQQRFSWIDNIDFVTDPGFKTILEGLLIENLSENGDSQFALTLPDYLELDAIQHIEYTTTDNRFFELDLDVFLNQMEEDETPLSIGALKENKIVVTLKEGVEQREWSVFECLTGEMDFEGRKILLEGGVFHQVSEEYLDQLDRYISALEEVSPDIDLPTSFYIMVDGKKQYQEEKEYNKSAASSAGILLLDRQNVVTVPGRTTPVEVCDLLSKEGHLIHIKRELSSSSLSHLFSQGYVSGNLLMTNPEFRRRAREKISGVSKGQKFDTEDIRAAIQSLIVDQRPGFRQLEVVFGIIDEWDLESAESLVDRLPFFSKVTLRTITQALVTMGFRVSYKRIPVEARLPGAL